MFLTSLFYLLSYSGHDYLPVKWVMDLLPHSPVDPVVSPNPTPDKNDKEGNEKKYEKTFSLAIR